jgi:predicted transcriptional regulator
MLEHMKHVLVEIDDVTAAALERVAPAKSRRRSEFIRRALRAALWKREERATREAYMRVPDRETGTYLDPGAWEPARRPPRRRR